MIRRARWRLTLVYAGVFVVILAVLGASTYVLLRRSLDEEIDRSLRSAVETWRTSTPRIDLLTPLPPATHDDDHDDDEPLLFVIAVRTDGAILANPSRVDAETFVAAGLFDRAPSGGAQWSVVPYDGHRYRVLSTPLMERQRVVGTIVAAHNMEAHDRELRTLLAVLLGAGGGGVLMAAGGGFVLAGRALRPIATAYERQRAFVGDASHELRSPLAVIRTSAEVLLRDPLDARQRETLEDLRDTSIEAAALVDGLLELARLDRAPAVAATTAIGLHETAADVVRQMQPLIEEHGSTVTQSGDGARAFVEANDLRRVIRALIENTLAHTPPGTSITIETTTHGHEAILRVIDDGPGVPETALDTLSDPFTRIDIARTPSSGHAGLGLAIAARHVERNHGRITFRNHLPHGLEAELRFRAG